MNVEAMLARLPRSVRACFRCTQEKWPRRDDDADHVVITFGEFEAAGARRGSIPRAIDFLEAAGLVARVGMVKRPKGHPACSYRLLVKVDVASTPVAEVACR